MLTTYADDASIFAALQAGARGHLTKEAGPEEIAAAIERVAGGPAMLDPIVQARLLDALDARRAAPPPITPPGQLPDGLTPREAEVLALTAEGSRTRRSPNGSSSDRRP